MNKPLNYLIFFSLAIFLLGCGGGNSSTTPDPVITIPPVNTDCDFDCFTGNGENARTDLSYSQLTTTSEPQFIDLSVYTVPSNAANPSNSFNGRITFTATEGRWTVIRDDGNYSDQSQVKQLPDFDYQFFQYGTHIIPVSRGLINTEHNNWQLILEPGRVWDENSDNGFSRVSLPFSLQEKGANCTHNGVMSFLFKNDGSVSSLAYQIASETCAYFQFNLFGFLSMSYIPETINDLSQQQSDYASEASNRIPVKPLAELNSDYPSANINVNTIASEINRASLTAFGVYYNGFHYTGNCSTRAGEYPFCEVLSLPSYSLAKSVFTGYGLMALEQQNPAAKSSIISNYVVECSGAQWSAVDFESALDMTTGNYTNAGFQADENSIAMAINFFSENSDVEKTAFSCSFPQKSNPKELWVYHTSDSYLLTKALDQYLAQDSYQWLVDTIYQPLNLSPSSYQTIRTLDTEQQSFGGYGLTFHADDIVKLANLLNLNQGQINGEVILDPLMVEETLQKTDYHGLNAGSPFDSYDNGFWIWKADEFLNCNQPLYIPYMSGFGGILVVLLPNKMVYYYFSDGGQFRFAETVNELIKIDGVCQ